MRARWWLPVVVLAALLLAGCESDDPAPASTRPTATPTPGGKAPARQEPPSRPMNDLERPVAERLRRQVVGQGLTLDYLDCPRWDGRVPVRMSCRAYVDGLVVGVAVHLRAAVEGRAVGFDASLDDGVIATRKLEQTLDERGWKRANCGEAAAYPADVGARIVCRVERDGRTRYLLATVTSRSGRVMITDYRPSAGR
ncbi:MAG: hypothetical protein HOQ22_14930 [Nocardioidaceae bacterium]|nr:hypothetical protein [Nocardioidaceae bacterium]NUS52321.1 hypothetical protein [Nocardioidaceae bacterium]